MLRPLFSTQIAYAADDASLPPNATNRVSVELLEKFPPPSLAPPGVTTLDMYIYI